MNLLQQVGLRKTQIRIKYNQVVESSILKWEIQGQNSLVKEVTSGQQDSFCDSFETFNL